MSFGPPWRRNFYLYQSANFISLLGDFVGSMALHWWILSKSSGISELSSIFVVGNIVRLVSLPLLGPIGDRYCRRNLLNLADLLSCISCVAFALIVYLDHTDLFIISIFNGILSLANSIFRAGSMGMVAELVPNQWLSRAISHQQIAMTMATILGSAISSLLISAVGIALAIILDACAIAVAIILIRNIKLNAPEGKRFATIGEWGLDFLQGLQFIIKRRPLVMALFIVVMINSLLVPFDLILPFYMQKVRAATVWQLGMIESSLALGSVLASLAFMLGPLRRRPLSIIFIALFLMAIALYLFSLSHSIASLVFFAGLFGASQVLFFIPVRSRIMLFLPQEFRSRVGVIFSFAQQLGSPVSIMMTSYLLRSFTVPMVLTSLASLILLLVPAIFFLPGFTKLLASDNT
ncbi:MAG TPA: MFS transporter [Myxococcota bacterium]|nr:MFS transporter [Myxococcota bacterium]